MADNTTLNEGSGGDVIASDDIAGVKHQEVKLEYGTDGVAVLVSATNPLPVKGGSVTVTPVILTQAVAVPGTAEALTAGSTLAVYLLVTAKKVGGVNVGNVYVGTSAVDKDASQQNILEPGDVWEFESPIGTAIDLNEFYIDAINAADGITGWYLPPAGEP